LYKYKNVLRTKKTDRRFVGIEILTEVVIKSSNFWNITPCSPLKFNRRFGGTSMFSEDGSVISQNIELFQWETYFPNNDHFVTGLEGVD
jgi:hypothetical protein